MTDDEIGYEGVAEGVWTIGLTSGEIVRMPMWAGWVAQDLSGEWWMYEDKPDLVEKESIWGLSGTTRCLKAGDGVMNPDWKDSLRCLEDLIRHG